MEKTKLFHAISSMGQRQRQEFSDYLASPFFNKRADVRQLWTILEALYPEGDEGVELDSEAVFKRGFPDDEFRPSQFNKLKTRLLNHFYAFLAHSSLKADPPQELLLQIRALNQQKNGPLLPARLRKAERMLDKRDAQDVANFFRRMDMEFERNAFLHEGTKRPESTNLPEMVENLQHGFLAQGLKLHFALQNENKILGKAHVWPLIAQIWPGLVTEEAIYPHLVRFYIHLNGLFHPQHHHHLIRLQELLREFATETSPSELRQVYIGALNHCARQLNSGAKEYEAEFLGLVREMIGQGILLEEGRISPWLFKNITTVALKQGEFEWAENFIQSHGEFIEEAHQTAAIDYNTALLHFYKGEFKAAQSGLYRLMQYCEDIFYHLDGRALLLRIYYAVGDGGAMESLSHSFRMYIERNKRISAAHKENYLTFIKFFRRLINTPPRDLERIRKLREDVLEVQWNSSGKEWILERIDALGEE